MEGAKPAAAHLESEKLIYIARAIEVLNNEMRRADSAADSVRAANAHPLRQWAQSRRSAAAWLKWACDDAKGGRRPLSSNRHAQLALEGFKGNGATDPLPEWVLQTIDAEGHVRAMNALYVAAEKNGHHQQKEVMNNSKSTPPTQTAEEIKEYFLAKEKAERIAATNTAPARVTPMLQLRADGFVANRLDPGVAKAQAAGEWQSMGDADRARWSSEETFTNVRSAMLTGKMRAGKIAGVNS